MEEMSEYDVCVALKRIYGETESRVKTEARVKRAYIGKISEDLVKEKVDNQLNSIKAEIHSINPRFKEGSKNFDRTKDMVTETLANYEKALIDLSEFYDGKIEQLILRKVELEASLIGSIINEEYLYNKIGEYEYQKKNDKVKNSIKENIKFAFDRLLNKKKEQKAPDPKAIASLMDVQDVENELEESMVSKIESISDKKIKNKEFTLDVEKQISAINADIEKLNDRKVKNLYDAMEIGDKSLMTSVRKPKLFGRITRFFISRFNTAKVVENSIIDPLRLRIESFKNNELSNIQG